MNSLNRNFEKPLKAQNEIEDILSNMGTTYYDITYQLMTVTDFKIEWQQELRAYTVIQIGKALDRLGVKQEIIKANGQTRKLRILPKKIYECDKGKINCHSWFPPFCRRQPNGK